MKYCPISYEHIEGNARYHRKGLNLLNSKLETLIPLSLNAQQLRQEAMNRASKLSIQGVQAKLSARLNVRENCFDIVDQNGTFILKPASDTWPELPANEAVTMTLAQKFGLDTPIHGLIFDASNEPVYFVKRFDRYGKGHKYAIEDFAQLTEKTRETKYNSSTEKLVKVIDTFTTFPKQQRIELFKRVLFCFCTGNEDMHLKNFSLIHMDEKIMLSPIYDFLNTTIALSHPMEELALPLKGKKNKLVANDFFEYFGQEYLNIAPLILKKIRIQLEQLIPLCDYYLPRSYLSEFQQNKYKILVTERIERLKKKI